MQLLGMTTFVRRQKPDSSFSHFDGSWDELLRLAEANWENRRPSPQNPAVRLVRVEGVFHNAMRELQPGEYARGERTRRRPDEDEVMDLVVTGDKGIAGQADLVFYPHALIADDPDCEGEAEWHLVSVEVRDEDLPMDPVTMARNQLGRPGGSVPDTPSGAYTSKQWAESVWHHRLMVRVDPT